MECLFADSQRACLQLILNDGSPNRLLVFEKPKEIICITAKDQISEAFKKIESALDKGLWAAGWFAYELGLHLEEKFTCDLPQKNSDLLLFIGLFDAPTSTTPQANETCSQYILLDAPFPTLDAASYTKKFNIVQQAIRDGDIYQLNLTFKSRFKIKGDPQALYQHLARTQPVKHGGFLKTDQFSILSLSPELFVKTRGRHIETRPMKGTEARGNTAKEDAAAREQLRGDAKQQAENLMIVDLMRNDLSRIAETGSVKVPKLFEVETYPTLHQMVSRVTGTLRKGVRVEDIFRALFPCGSITGAPKIRAMEIIRDLEAEPRGVYCGAMGYLSPHHSMHFNVAIRTIMIAPDGAAEIGVGSGIVADSDAASEYQEALLKMRFLTEAMTQFDLFETMLYQKDKGIWLFDEHMTRLRLSAYTLGFRFDEMEARSRIVNHCESHQEERLRVRLLLKSNGTLRVTSTALQSPLDNKPIKFVISPTKLQSNDLFLRHKTTCRRVYDSEFAYYNKILRVDEVIYINENEELAEGSRTNIFILIDGQLLTPPLECGLLPGTLRTHLLAEAKAIESRLTRESLDRAEKIYLGNSVRGLQEAVLI